MIVAGVIMSAVAAGCSPLAPRPDPSEFFILSPIAASSVTTRSAGSQFVIGLGPIDFPGYLRRRQMVMLTSTNQVDLSPVKRWAEPLDVNFERVLGQNLGVILNTQRIVKFPWPRSEPVDYQVVVNVLSFETTTAGQSQMNAQWIIRDSAGKDLYASQTVASAAVPAGDAGESAALSDDLGKLSNDIAARITTLNQNRQSPAEE